MCCAEEVRPGEGAAGQKCGHFFQSGFRKRSYEIIMPAADGPPKWSGVAMWWSGVAMWWASRVGSRWAARCTPDLGA